MIIPGRNIIPRIITNAVNPEVQVQPCGLDLTLKYVRTWSQPGTVDLDRKLYLPVRMKKMAFAKWHKQRHEVDQKVGGLRQQLTDRVVRHFPNRGTLLESIVLQPGTYQVEFFEHVDMPADKLGMVTSNNYMFAAGGIISAPPIRSGFQSDAMYAMLQVVNPHGVVLFRQASIAQLLVHQMSEPAWSDTDQVNDLNWAYQAKKEHNVMFPDD